MSSSDLRTEVWQEIQHVPDNRLRELLALIHTFRLRVEPVNTQSRSILEFAGCWNDLPNETFTEFLDDISSRRQQAFSQRQSREASPG
ncbi:MAG: hypothetical protein SFY66_21285 [Oculatellaceae cyanobacterium bins.114]|nr:hypothetical protein [Oculatellaceae cyanobacterium bins.114]